MSDGGRSFRWEQLDQRLLRPKLDELSEEMQTRSIQATNKAAYDTRESGNPAGYFPRLFEAQRQLTDEWAQRLYDVHCEVWQIQGNTVTPEFIRTVGKKAVTELIVTRKGTVEYTAQLLRTRKWYRGRIPLGSWTRTIIQLRSRWVNKLEAEAVAIEYRSRRVAISNAPPPPSVVRGSYVLPKPKQTVPLDCLPPYYPASLATKTHLVICSAVKKFPFQTHVIELCKYVLTKLRPHFLKAVRSGELKQDLALPTARELIHWLLVDNCDNDSRKSEFQGDVLRSAEWFKLARGVDRATASTRINNSQTAALQATPLLRFGKSAVNLLARELREFRRACRDNLIFVRIPIPRRGDAESEKAAYGSAIHCLRDCNRNWITDSVKKMSTRVGDLFNVATEFRHQNPEDWAKSAARAAIQMEFPTTSLGFLGYQDRATHTWLCEQLEEWIDHALVAGALHKNRVPRAEPSRTRMRRKRSKEEIRRAGIVFAALQANLEGPTYCAYLDRHSFRIRAEWRSEGCPPTYVAAYRSGQPWSKRIQDQKHRYRCKFDQISKAEREELIQNATRPTR